MECKSNKIKMLIIEIMPLLEFGEHKKYWLGYLNYILENINSGENKREMVRSLRSSFLGGMGSFSDLVLHKDGVPLIDENNQLDNLKDKLYDACEKYLKE